MTNNKVVFLPDFMDYDQDYFCNCCPRIFIKLHSKMIFVDYNSNGSHLLVF